jgi:hypothetical protein
MVSFARYYAFVARIAEKPVFNWTCWQLDSDFSI